MRKFNTFSGIAVPFNRANIDTDMIIPKQFLKSIKRTGFGPNLFDELRYQDEGQPGMDNSQRPLNPDFILNQPRYKGAEILLAGENFGCGSSREHAPWALDDFGFKVIIASSYADIFFNNCFKNGLLPVILAKPDVESLMAATEAEEGFCLEVNLEEQTVSVPGGQQYRFEVDPFRKYCLVNGLDDIGLTLQDADAIREYEKNRAQQAPWLFAGK